MTIIEQITQQELHFRDNLWPIYKFTKIIGKIENAANILTILGFIVLIYSIYDFWIFRSISRQIIILLAIWTTDFLDGPTARNNNNITALGTALDHARDFSALLWMKFLTIYSVYYFIDSLDFQFLYFVVPVNKTVLTIAFLYIFSNILKAKKRQPELSLKQFLNNFLLNEIKTSITGRLYFFISAVGHIIFLTGVAMNIFIFMILGAYALLFRLMILGFYIHELLQEPYEKRLQKIRLRFERKTSKKSH